MVVLDRITLDAGVMGGKPCIKGTRVTVGTIVGLVAAGRTIDEVLDAPTRILCAQTCCRLSHMLRGAPKSGSSRSPTRENRHRCSPGPLTRQSR